MEPQSDDKRLVEVLSTLKAELKKQLASARRAEKACEKLAETGALKRLTAVEKHLPLLDDVDLAPFGLEEQRLEVMALLTPHRERLRAQTRAAVLSGLSQQGLEVSLLAETPITLLVAPLTVELDIEAAKARVMYAREVVSECAPDVAAIVKARQAAMDDIRKRASSSELFFGAAHQAYKTVLMARGLREGERVDLVDLLGPLALLDPGVDEWRKLGAGKGFAPYPRFLLAYQLQRLRREGLLTHAGLRLELGTATAGSTKNKKNVLFIPTTPAEGQYYLSLRFLPTEQ
jgi:hypothetical protein